MSDHLPTPLPFASLTLIDDPVPRPAGLNMALDEVLLAVVADAAVLRCYRWSEPSASFGCFGRIADVRRAHPSRRLVRRWTGGGIVDHWADFTFSLLVSRRQPLVAVRARDSYRLVHEAVARALAPLAAGSVNAARPPDRPAEVAAQDAPHLKPCFAHPVAFDLLVDGRKVAGGAQRRTRDGLLHQGSIQGLFDRAGPDEAARRSLGRALASTLGRVTVVRHVTSGELARAVELAACKYDAPAWAERL